MCVCVLKYVPARGKKNTPGSSHVVSASDVGSSVCKNPAVIQSLLVASQPEGHGGVTAVKLSILVPLLPPPPPPPLPPPPLTPPHLLIICFTSSSALSSSPASSTSSSYSLP